MPSGTKGSANHQATSTPLNPQPDGLDDQFHIPPIGSRAKQLLDIASKRSAQDFFKNFDPIEEVVEYYQVESPYDLVIVYGFKYIIYDHDRFPSRKTGRDISFFKKVNRVYFKGVQMHRLGYDGDLRTGIEYELPVGKLLIIYERHCFIPYISLSVNRRKLLDSPSNPKVRAQHSGKMVSQFGEILIVIAILIDIFRIMHTKRIEFSWQLWSIIGAGLIYLLCGYGIKSMKIAASAFTCIFHPAIYLMIIQIIIHAIPGMFSAKPATDFTSIYVSFQMFFLIPITFLFGYYYLFIINAFKAINDDSNC